MMIRLCRRITAFFLIITLCLTSGVTAAATGTEDVQELTAAEKKEKKEQKRVYELPIQTNELTDWPEGPGTYGEAAIVMEVGTGAILYAKNIDEHYFPASITKLLTVLVAMENGELDDKITFSEDSLSFLEWGDAYIGMKEGNVISLEQALYAILLASANEVAYATGESVGKNAGYDYDWFIEKMNEKCRELGGTNSNFVNTNGLHDDDHYTCARDMALIARELFKYPEVFEIMQTWEYKIKKSRTTERHVFQQNHQMLTEGYADYYENAIGGKTGYTDQALSTLVTMADNGDMQLVCVVLKTRGVNVYPDTRHLFDYAYENFQKVKIDGQETSGDVGEIISQEEASQDGGLPEADYVVIPKNISFDSLDMELTPDEDARDEAVLTYSYEGNYVGGAHAKLSDSYIEKHSVKIEKKTEKDSDNDKPEAGKDVQGQEKKKNKKEMIKFLCIVLIFLIILLLIYVMIQRKRKRKRRRRRR